ncbi:ADP-ribose pyrophosphatase YjhB (NUDIX family) [Rudaeicoccus suwonensis]|uniref:ADP-ribose pyrophosphatase YjhB (NUDIX family) n=2 Tax=Rudaeicoccus suwonensis TaxID=657409 RepID=A0A561EAM1_9MICO|nr:ADP-ribose pyrophosphatase YjhB (NUDIX family) [Rudaeicoccus suwonensis]
MNASQPVISVDPVALRHTGEGVGVVLVERQFAPFRHRRALPGVMLAAGESAHAAALRGLRDKCGVEAGAVRWQAAGRYNDERNRDPRGATISLTQILVLDPAAHGWEGTWAVPLTALPKLPFAHSQIVADAVEDLLARFWVDTRVIPAFLGATFSTLEVAVLAEYLGVEMSQANLARRLGTMFTDTGRSQVTGRGRPARLWTTEPPPS